MKQKKKVLFMCTGNSCRSQMAEGLLRHMAGDQFEVFSSGSHPSHVHPLSVKIMDEIGIDISRHTSDHVDQYLDKGIDIVITVCDHANQVCPVFPGEVKRIHWSVDDPFRGWGDDDRLLSCYRETRSDLKRRIEGLLETSV
jgi:arsenate reductase